jgi:methylase of polypeptide subunit release factors
MLREICKTDFPDRVELITYEIHTESAHIAAANAKRLGQSKRYKVVNRDFFEAAPNIRAQCAIANPPYLPAHSAPSIMPELWGGRHGDAVCKRLFDYDFEHVVSMLSSYSNPLGVIEHARKRGYRVEDFEVEATSYGIYSHDDQVWRRIKELADAGKAFVADDFYNLAAVTWVSDGRKPDLSLELFERIRITQV